MRRAWLALCLLLLLLVSACDRRLVLVHERDAGTLDAATPVGVDGLAAGVDHTCFLLASALYCTGHDGSGQLGLPDDVDRLVPTRVDIGTSWTAISAGYASTCLLDAGGALSCFGDNASQQLGTGDAIARPAPTRVSLAGAVTSFSIRFEHACAVLDDASLWCWGSNAEGELGQGDGGSLPHGVPVRVAPDLSWSEASCGQGHTCALTTDGAAYCWGRNMGALGLGPSMLDETSVPMRAGTGTYRHVVAGQNHTCAIGTDDALWCWGDDTDADGHAGPVGLPGSSFVTVPTRVDAGPWASVSTDTFHTCAIRTSGELWCWGRNIEGQLGTGDLEVVDTPQRIGADSDWARVAVGRFFTCAQKRDGSVWCTGANDFGELGIGVIERRDVFTLITPVAP